MALSASSSSFTCCLEGSSLGTQLTARRRGCLTRPAVEQSCAVLRLHRQVAASPRGALKSWLLQRNVVPIGPEHLGRQPPRNSVLQRQRSGNRQGVLYSLPETRTSEAETHEDAGPSVSSESRSAVEHESGSPEASNGSPKDAEKNNSASKSSALSSLDSYFQQLAGTAAAAAPQSSNPKSVSADARPSTVLSQASSTKSVLESPKKKGTKDQEALSALDAYFDMLNPPKPPEPEVEKPPPAAASEKTEVVVEDTGFRQEVIDAWKKTFEDEVDQEDAIDMAQKALDIVIAEELSPWNRFLEKHSPANGTNTLAAISVAVYLFELASPQTIPGNFATSLPNLFGAKVNELIAQGEWWRLFTPSLLHAGFFHIGLSVWAMLTFGPQVEAAYGTTTFVVLYFLTGAFGNLMSFGQTQDPTIGGTGPIYGLVGAWLIFLIKNRDVIGKEKADNMTRQAIFLSALNVALGNPLPIDDWTHIGAALGGLLMGSLCAPQLVKKPKEKTPDDTPIDVSFKSLSEVFGGKLDYKKAQKNIDYTLDREALDYKKLALTVGISLGIFVVLLQLGLAADVDVLPSLLRSNDNIDFI